MTIVFQNTDIIGVGNGVTRPTLVNGEQFILAPDTMIVSTFRGGIVGNTVAGAILDYSMLIGGHIYANEIGIWFGENQTGQHVDYSLVVSETGVVSAHIWNAVSLTHAQNWDAAGEINFVNHGLVVAEQFGAVHLAWVPTVNVTNTRTTQSFGNTTTSSSDQAYEIVASTGTLFNSGLIQNAPG